MRLSYFQFLPLSDFPHLKSANIKIASSIFSFINFDLLNFPFTSIPLPATTQNGRVAGLVVIPFRFPKIILKSLTSNPLSQIATSNPRLQPDTHFAVDMFPYKKTGPFQMSGLTSQLPKKPGNTPLSGTYLSFLDINTTVSICASLSKLKLISSAMIGSLNLMDLSH